MKRMVALAMVMAFLGMSGAAFAQMDMSWWGNTGALPEPVKDDTHPGYWWWPTDPDPTDDDTDMWGNRGCVYGMWTPPAPPPPPVPPQPPIEEPMPVQRTVPIFNHVLFDFDRSELKPAGIAEIQKVIALLNEYPNDTLLIEGHTDSVGTDAYNMGLGQRRADSIKNYMVNNGIAASRLSTVSYGESQPAVPNDSPANRALNRRGIFVYSIGDN